MKHLQNFLCFLIFLITIISIQASCPATTPWTTPIGLTLLGNVAGDVYSAATNIGFLATWADTSNNGRYAFSTDGKIWNTGSITSAQGVVLADSDIFVAGNSTGFVATWIDLSNNAWSSFTSDNGQTWSSAVRINPDSLVLNTDANVFVAASEIGFVATMISDDQNAYVSFSKTGTSWSQPTQVTTSNDVYPNNGVGGQTPVVTRGYVNAVVVKNSCVLTWILDSLATESAYLSSIEPFSAPIITGLGGIGFFESVPVSAYKNGYYLNATRANVSSGQIYFATSILPLNWALFTGGFTTNPAANNAGPWVAANQTGFMATWNNDGNPIWTFSNNNGFNFTSLCSILSTASTTIVRPIGLSGNAQGFVASWRDTSDSNAYITFYETFNTINKTFFVPLLQQKYGPIL